MRAFTVPITVQVRVEVDVEEDVDIDVARSSADLVGKFLAQRIEQTLVPKPGVIRVIDTDVGYPEHIDGGA